jgi:hypothetical protein
VRLKAGRVGVGIPPLVNPAPILQQKQIITPAAHYVKTSVLSKMVNIALNMRVLQKLVPLVFIVILLIIL